MMANDAAEPDAKPQVRLYVSHAREDTAFVDRLQTALAARGFELLTDRTEAAAGKDPWKRIEAIIAHADTFAFVVSPDSIATEACGKELAFAQSLNKRLAPIVRRRVDDSAVPQALAKLNFIFFDDERHFDASMDKLVAGLSTDIGWIRKHTELGEAARRWMTEGRPGPRGLLLRPPALEQAERWIAARPANTPPPTEELRAFIEQSRRAETNRRGKLAASLTIGLGLALVLAAGAVWKWVEAVRLKQTTLLDERTTSQLTDMSRTYSEQVSGLWNGNLLIATATRKGIELSLKQDAKSALDFAHTARPALAQMKEVRPTDHDVLLAIALNEEQIGDAIRAQGDRAGALAAYQDALASIVGMSEDDRTKPAVQRWRAFVLMKVAAVGGDEEAAWTEALDIFKRLQASGQLSTDDRTAMAQIEKSLADRRRKPARAKR
jgi:hypothetical protein